MSKQKVNVQLEKDIKLAGLTLKQAALVRKKYEHVTAVSFEGFPEFHPDFDWSEFTESPDLDALYERMAGGLE